MAKFYSDMLLKYYFLLNKNLLKLLRLFKSEFSGLLWHRNLQFSISSLYWEVFTESDLSDILFWKADSFLWSLSYYFRNESVD